MAPVSMEQEVAIIRRLNLMSIELEDIKAYAEMTYRQYQEDRKSRRDVERMIENLVNASLDVAKILISAEDLEIPATYREAFIRLGEAGVIDEDLALAMAQQARARNVLAHQYLDIQWSMIKDFLAEGIPKVKLFKQAIEKRLAVQDSQTKEDETSTSPQD